MTDKQIIIDGVDVSGCNCFIEKMNFPNNLEGGYYNQNNLCECGVQGVESYPFFCRNNPNCHYKQLKRKGQECEELKQTLAEIKGIAKEQIPYPNFGEVKTMIEIEYDYAGKIYNLEQRMYKILQKISEYKGEYNEKIRQDRSSKHAI